MSIIDEHYLCHCCNDQIPLSSTWKHEPARQWTSAPDHAPNWIGRKNDTVMRRFVDCMNKIILNEQFLKESVRLFTHCAIMSSLLVCVCDTAWSGTKKLRIALLGKVSKYLQIVKDRTFDCSYAFTDQKAGHSNHRGLCNFSGAQRVLK